MQVTPFKPTLPIGYGIRLTATAIYDDGTTFNVTGQSTWASSNGGVATVSNAVGSRGRVTPVAAGTASISATYNGVIGIDRRHRDLGDALVDRHHARSRVDHAGGTSS